MDAKQMVIEGQSILLKDEAARNAIADEYDSTSTYSVGDYCIYGGVFYRCTTAVTTAGSFDSTKWTATQVGDELIDIEADIPNSPFTGTDGTNAGTMGLVPAPTTSDTNKYLKSDGTWATVSGGGGASVQDLTQADYNALTTAQKKNGTIYMTHDGGYDFINYDNGAIIVRVNNTTQETLWFFRGWYKSTTADVDIPDELASYAPTTTSPTYSKNFPSGGTTQDGWIGFYNNKIRAWNQALGGTISGYMYGVVNIAGGANQTNEYTQPTERLTLEPNRIYHNDVVYSEVQDLDQFIKVKTYTYIYNISADTSLHISANSLQMATPTGYTPLAIVRFNSGEQDIYVRNVNINATGTASAMSVKNTATSNKSNVTATLVIAYIKSAYIVV